MSLALTYSAKSIANPNMLSLLITIPSLVIVLLIIYLFSTRKFGYWEQKNVPCLKPTPLLGNYGDVLLLKSNLGSHVQSICQQLPKAPLVGAYFGTEPVLIVQDPDLIKLVTTRDFYYFSSREISEYVHNEGLLKNLFSTYGDEWKVLRQNLTPIFSSAKMKNMFCMIEKCSRTLEQLFDESVKETPVLEVRTFMGRFTMDCIGICAFGLDTKAMGETNSPFTTIGDLIFQATPAQGLKNVTKSVWPGIFYALGFTAFPKEVDAFFRNLLAGVFNERRGKPSMRNDFIQLVLSFYDKKYISGDSLKNMKMNERKKVDLKVDDELLMAQCFAFFAAGYETSATTASFTLYELAKHADAQERVRTEIREWLKKRGGTLAYECVSELPYLEQCVDETLRLYPVLGVITRELVEPYRFPDGLTVDRGLRVHLPVYHMHHNPEYFPEPEEYRPERFAPENKHNIYPYSYFPFGEGPRICIGMRFARMQMYSGLITVLKKYRVELADGMPSTIQFEPKSIVTQSKFGIKLKFTALEDSESYKYPSENVCSKC